VRDTFAAVATSRLPRRRVFLIAAILLPVVPVVAAVAAVSATLAAPESQPAQLSATPAGPRAELLPGHVGESRAARRPAARNTSVSLAVDADDLVDVQLPPTPRPGRAKPSPGTTLRDVQLRLAQLGYIAPESIDGVDGDATRFGLIAFQAWEGLDRDGTSGPTTIARLRTAEAPRPDATSAGRRIEVYRDKGVALLLDGTDLTRVIHISSGAPGYTTPSGQFTVGRKELNSWSYKFKTWLPYASYFVGGIAFHQYPDVPAYPASHGCVRVPYTEAPMLYEFAQPGTEVAVF
jgi:lipoprotein-anchoring transpeptidase ErfK/SrfK